MASEDLIFSEALKLAGEEERLKKSLQASALELKLLAEELERERKTDKVEQVAGMTMELVEMQHALEEHIAVLKGVRDWYQPPAIDPQAQQHQQSGARGRRRAQSSQEPSQSAGAVVLTDWASVLQGKVEERRHQGGAVPQDPQEHEWVQQLKRTVWNVHHANEPMPGENAEEEEVAVLTQTMVKNITCPVTMKSLVDLEDAVCNGTCRHVYSRSGIMGLMEPHRRSRPIRCPVAGCSSKVAEGSLVDDEELRYALAELRTRQRRTGGMGTGTAGGGSGAQDFEDI